MTDLVQVNYNDNTVMARDVYEFVYKGQESKTTFSHWFKRAVNKYGFIEGSDFTSILTESTGGRPKIDYVVSLDMGKELAMVSPTDQGKIVRKYFLKCEKIAQEKAVTRAIGKETRKTLTNAIEVSGENERMHGRGHSNYTLLVYAVTGLKQRFKMYKNACKDVGVKPNDFRGTLSVEEIKRVDLAESLIKPMLELEKEYSEIKEAIIPLFEVKEIE